MMPSSALTIAVLCISHIIINVKGQLPEYVGKRDRFWKHHKVQKTLVMEGEEKYSIVQDCLKKHISIEEFEMMKLHPSNREVGRRIVDDPDNWTGNVILVEVKNAISPIHVKAVKILTTCIQTHIPSLHEKRPMYLELGLSEDPGLGGNSPTHLAPLINVFLPDVVEDMHRTLKFAYEAAGWNQLTIRDEIRLNKFGLERGLMHPDPDHLGFKACEHLTYKDFPSLAKHTDGATTAYTLNYAFSAPDDYEGGYLYLDDNNGKRTHLKPNKYSAIVFLGGIYSHGVTEISGGTREAFSTETWFNPDIPVGTTLWTGTIQSMEDYIWKCNQAGHTGEEGPCPIKFSELTANGIDVEQNKKGNFDQDMATESRMQGLDMYGEDSYDSGSFGHSRQTEESYAPYSYRNLQMGYNSPGGQYEEPFSPYSYGNPQMGHGGAEQGEELYSPYQHGNSQMGFQPGEGQKPFRTNPYQNPQMEYRPDPEDEPYSQYTYGMQTEYSQNPEDYLEYGYDFDGEAGYDYAYNESHENEYGEEYGQEYEGEEEMKFFSETEEPNFFVPTEIPPGLMYPLTFRDTDEHVDNDEAFSIGLPPELLKEFQDYIERSGLLRMARRLIYEDGAYCGKEHCLYKSEDNKTWGTMKTQWNKGDMVWIDPADEECFESLISVLRRGNFDMVLETIGEYFELDSLMIQGIGPIFLSHFAHDPEYKQVHRDLIGGKGSFFNVVVPLYIPEGGATLYVGDDERTEKIQMRYNYGTLLGAETPHGTGECDYREQKDVRLSVAIYIADVSDHNLELVASDSTSLWPTIGDLDWFERQKGRFWKSDGSRSLKNDKGRSPLNIKDLESDCETKNFESCMTDPIGFRVKCPKTCNVYLNDAAYYNIIELEKIEKIQIEKEESHGQDKEYNSVDNTISETVIADVEISPNVESKILNDLINWLLNEDGYINERIAFDVVDETDENSVAAYFAMKSLQKNETIMVIPRPLLIDAGRSRDMCDLARKIAKEYSMKDASKFSPFMSYIFDFFHHASVPTSWSIQGKKLFLEMIGDELSPQHFGQNTFQNTCGPARNNEKNLEAAWAIVLSRSWNDVLIPVYDMMNHRNGKWKNVDQVTSAHSNDDIVIVATRDIAPGEQLFLSYNECNDEDCDGIAHSYTLQSIVADYGFVEQYPRRFTFEIFDEVIVFEVDVNERNEMNLIWLEQEPATRHLNWMKSQLKRLNSIKETIIGKSKALPEFEKELIIAFHKALTSGLEEALVNSSIKDQQCESGKIDDNKTCHVSNDEYDNLEDSLEILEYDAFECNSQQYDYEQEQLYLLDEVNSHYQEIEYVLYENMETEKTDTCLRLSGWLQTCSSFRPHYHELLVHYPASFLSKVKRVLYLGGGDNMILHEILKYESIELVVGMELDQQVVRSSFKNMGIQPHFDNSSVQWWFGDASKSLRMLPLEYYGTFDLVMVDLQTYVVNTLKVTEDKTVMDVALLLLKSDGILVQNEDFTTRNNVDFSKYRVALEYSGLSRICKQSINMGSETINFMRQKPLDHDIESKIFESISQNQNQFKGWWNYGTSIDHSAKKAKDWDEFQKSIIDQKNSESYGLMLILEIEDITKEITSSSLEEMTKTTGLSGPTLYEVYLSDERNDFLITFRQGYIMLRLFKKHTYCALDLMLWESFNEQDAILKGIIRALDGNVSTSYRLVTGGKLFNETLTENNTNENTLTHLYKNDNEIMPDVSFDKSMMSTLLQEMMTLVKNVDPVIIVLCSDLTESCSTLDVLTKKAPGIQIIPIRDCSKDKNADAGLEVCESKVLNELVKSIVVPMKKISGIVIDPDCKINLAKIVLKVLTNSIFIKDSIMEHYVVFTPELQTKSKWRKIFLERFRTKIVRFSPAHTADIVFKSKSKKLNLGIFSSLDENFYSNLQKMVESSEAKTGLAAEISSIKDGILSYNAEPDPIPFISDLDYINEASVSQWKNQKPVGRQIILQYEREVLQAQIFPHEDVLVNIEKNEFYGKWYPATITTVHDNGSYDLILNKKKEKNFQRHFIRKYDSSEEASQPINAGEALLIKDEDGYWSPGALLEVVEDDIAKVQINDDEGTVTILGRMRIMKREETVKIKSDRVISTVSFLESLEKTLVAVVPSTTSLERHNSIGNGSLLSAKWSEGIIIASWDGDSHIDLNIFSSSKKNVSLSKRFNEKFLQEMNNVNLVARDEHPRGYGHVVNFAEDLINPPYWLSI